MLALLDVSTYNKYAFSKGSVLYCSTGKGSSITRQPLVTTINVNNLMHQLDASTMG